MIVLDTCAILWDALSPGQLSRKATATIANAAHERALVVSDISLWEIAMLIKKERLLINISATKFLQLFLQSRNVEVRTISPEIAELSANLGPEIGNDPADRIIAATAIMSNAHLITADQRLRDFGLLKTIW